MIQIGMTGEDIGFSKTHGELAGVGVKLGTGFSLWEEMPEDLTVAVGFSESVQNFPVLIQNLYGKPDALIKGFQQFVKFFLFNNGI